MGEKVTSFEQTLVLDWKIPPTIEINEVGCGINSILTLTYNLPSEQKIEIDAIKEIFKFDSEGIRNEKYLFNKLSTLLSKKKCPCKIFRKDFNSKKELIEQLEKTNLPVPVYFDMEVLKKINPIVKKFTSYEYNDKDTYLTNNQHILLLVGYSHEKKHLYFIDPNYILPSFKDEKTLKIQNALIMITDTELYQLTKQVQIYIELKCNKKETKILKNGLTKYLGK